MLLTMRIKLILAGAVALGVGLFLLAFYLRGKEIEQCDAERAAIEAVTEQMKVNNDKAVNEFRRNLERQRRVKENVMRDANAVKDNTTSPAIANAASLLCNQGAAGCGASRAN